MSCVVWVTTQTETPTFLSSCMAVKIIGATRLRAPASSRMMTKLWGLCVFANSLSLAWIAGVKALTASALAMAASTSRSSK